mmetsp:Transcript_5157/g.6245  ORF Transcript_5157/g.6245 Transcript_5157/m.6245 type:complete len:446 (+) Transcript_5157:1484-2821(+)
MQWLIANMWMALAAAAVLGLLFGFSFRGVMSSNRVRRAEIEREIARTELTQSKAEAEALYAAQRKRKEESAQLASGDDTLQAELTERENRITALGEELRGARSELEALKSDPAGDTNLGQMAGAAVAGAVAGAVLSDDDQEELTKLRDRNTWLEERVGALETDLAAQSASEPALVTAATSAPDATGSSPSIEKLNWQSAYMRQRVAALESKLIETTAAASVATVASEQVAELVAAPTPEPETAIDNEPSGETDEELAQLRWRNRYLEGRLAYFEQTPEGEDEADTEAEADAPKLVEDAASEPEPEPEPDSDPEPEAVTESEPDNEVDVAPETAEIAEDLPASEETEAVIVAEDDVHPSEAMLAELEGTQPQQVEQPDSGGDDLTTITGIGPRIAEVLNSLGIWTYSQIAEWQPEHETWIENHLSFKGRVSRENWVGQAKDLLVSA